MFLLNDVKRISPVGPRLYSPSFHYPLPLPSVFRVLKEQWIRAKYERKEFSEPTKNYAYEEGECTPTNTSSMKVPCVEPDWKLCWLSAGIRDGMLMKRGRDNGQFLSRRFVLSEREGTLKYFTKYDVSTEFPGFCVSM